MGNVFAEANTLKQTLSIAQNQDTKIMKIHEDLEKRESKFYELRDGLVYRKAKGNNLLFFVLELMINNVMRVSHDDLGT